MLLNNLPDLILDTPEAAHLMGNFLARAVADDALPPKYVHQLSQNGSRHSPKTGNGNGIGNGEPEAKASHRANGVATRTLNEYAQQALDYAEGWN